MHLQQHKHYSDAEWHAIAVLVLIWFAIICSILCPYVFDCMWLSLCFEDGFAEPRPCWRAGDCTESVRRNLMKFDLQYLWIRSWQGVAGIAKTMKWKLFFFIGRATTFVKSLNVVSEVCSVQDLWSFWWPGCLAPCSGLLASSKSLAHILVMGIPRHLYFLHGISLQDSSCPMGGALIFKDCSPEGAQS